MTLRKHQRDFSSLIDRIAASGHPRAIIAHVTPGGGKSTLPIIATRLLKADLYQDDRANKFLKENWNALTLYVLDGEIIKVMRYCGLQDMVMKLFRDTVIRQISQRITREQYNSAVDYLYRSTSEDIFIKGHYFAHKELQP